MGTQETKITFSRLILEYIFNPSPEKHHDRMYYASSLKMNNVLLGPLGALAPAIILDLETSSACCSISDVWTIMFTLA